MVVIIISKYMEYQPLHIWWVTYLFLTIVPAKILAQHLIEVVRIDIFGVFLILRGKCLIFCQYDSCKLFTRLRKFNSNLSFLRIYYLNVESFVVTEIYFLSIFDYVINSIDWIKNGKPVLCSLDKLHSLMMH